MERLTQRCGDSVLLDVTIDGLYTEREVIDLLATKLAAYEDIGLEPQEIISAICNPMVRRSIEKACEILVEKTPALISAIVEKAPSIIESGLELLKKELEEKICSD